MGTEVIRILSIVSLVGFIAALDMARFYAKKRRDLGSVKASKQWGFVLLYHVWHVLSIFPLVFYLVGIIMPSWVYGTILNLSFQGGEYLQVFSLPLFFIGSILIVWSTRVLRQFMVTEIQVLQKQELVTTGPYSRIRHPAYTGTIIMALGASLFFLNIIMIVAFLAISAIAYKRAVLEEELLASEDGFGQDYRNYMKKTGRFLPRL